MVHARLLGPPALDISGRRQELAASKRSALLAYVACRAGESAARSDLLLLLWTEMPDARARRALRQMLHEIGGSDLAPTLEVDGPRVRFVGKSDAASFRRLVERREWREALDAWGGAFLEGWERSLAPGADAWIEEQRAEFDTAHRRALRGRAGQLERVGDLPGAAALLGEVWRSDVLAEGALERELWLLGRAGRRAEAAREARAYRERFARELEVGPEGTLAELLAAAEAGEDVPEPEAEAPPDAAPELPTAASPLVGRAAERREVEALLGREGVSLVSLVAPGGMGKTRLALAVAASLRGEYRDGVAFAGFAATADPAGMEGTLAQALGVAFSAGSAPRGQLMGRLASKKMLLVFDNLEHLTEDLSLLSEILQRCPGIDILATSRERLHLAREWVYDLPGLARPEPGAEAAATYDSVALFVQAGRRVRRNFQPTDEELELTARLCRQVGGMPLALELAAAWLRILPLEEIVTSVERGVGLLQSGEVDVPVRHRSVRAVLAATWERLDVREREAWARLSICEGGFTRDAAAAVAEADPPTLLALVDRAIVVREEGERFTFHPLLAQFGRERAQVLALPEDARRRHARHYLRFATGFEERVKGREQAEALRAFARELPNVRAAWRAAAEFGEFTLLAAAAPAVTRFYDIQRRNSELATLCDAAVASLERRGARDESPERQRLLARTLVWTSRAHEAPLSHIQRALHAARRVDDENARAELHKWLAWLPIAEDAREHFEASVALYKEVGDDHGHADALLRFAERLAWTGHFFEARRLLERALDLARRLGNRQLEGEILAEAAHVGLLSGELDRAEAYGRRAGEIYRVLDLHTPHAEVLARLGQIARLRGNLDEAERRFEEFFAMCGPEHPPVLWGAQEELLRADLCYARGDWRGTRSHASAALSGGLGSSFHRATALLRLVRADIRLDELVAAREHLREASALVPELRFERMHLTLDAAVAAAELVLREGDGARAARFAAAAAAHRATPFETLREIDALCEAGLEEPDSTDRRAEHDLARIQNELTQLFADG